MVQRNTHSRLIALLVRPLILHSIIISFVAAWLARVLLSFKRVQSSGNDDVDEGQKTPFLCIKDYYVPE